MQWDAFECLWMRLNALEWILGCIGMHRNALERLRTRWKALVSCIGMHHNALDMHSNAFEMRWTCIKMHLNAFEWIWMHLNSLECIGMHWNELECIGMRWNALECIGMRWNACEYIWMHWHALECVSMRWHVFEHIWMNWDELGCIGMYWNVAYNQCNPMHSNAFQCTPVHPGYARHLQCAHSTLTRQCHGHTIASYMQRQPKSVTMQPKVPPRQSTAKAAPRQCQRVPQVTYDATSVQLLCKTNPTPM